jgi:2-polyprenyl-6-methoxyphenol hydroxylase-like FAD-dependent oxidoreductase
MRVVICGAGIAGLALAQRLDAFGWEVVVLEKAPGPRPQGYMIDFFGPGYDAAEAMGVLPRLEELGYRFEEASWLDETGRRRARLRFEQFGKIEQDRLFSILRPDLEQALREQLAGNIDLRFATSLSTVHHTAGGVRVTLRDGGTLNADVLVGADGIHSTVRGLVFGEERAYLRYLGFHTAAYVFDDPQIHTEVDGRLYLTDTIDRQMGLYGLRDGRVATFAVHRAADPALPPDPVAAIRREYGSLGWIIQQALDRCPPAAKVYYDQVAQIELPQWSRHRVVLRRRRLRGLPARRPGRLAGHRRGLRPRRATGPGWPHRHRAAPLRAVVAASGRGETANRPQRGPLVPSALACAAPGTTRCDGAVLPTRNRPLHRPGTGRQVDSTGQGTARHQPQTSPRCGLVG